MNQEDVFDPEKNPFLKSLQDIADDKQTEIESGAENLVKNVTEHGKVLPKDALNISDKTLEQLYAHGYNLYNLGKYEDAKKMFGSLIMANVTEPRYLFGLAACDHMLKNFDTAASQYVKCSMLDVKSPIPFYHASDCFLELEDIQSAMITLHMTVKRCGEKSEFSTMKERASMTLENLKKQVKEGKKEVKADKGALNKGNPELEK